MTATQGSISGTVENINLANKVLTISHTEFVGARFAAGTTGVSGTVNENTTETRWEITVLQTQVWSGQTVTSTSGTGSSFSTDIPFYR